MRGAVNRRRIKRRLTALAVLVGGVLFITLISNNLRPVIHTVSANQARILCTSTVNQTVMEELGKLDLEYDNLVTLKNDSLGRINAIETNALEVNRLQARLTDAVSERLSLLPNQNVSIPLGTLTGIELLSGRGPRVKLKMIPSSYVGSELVNRFDGAGINQTRHQLMINFNVSMSAILAPYTTSVEVSVSICIAETVIIGVVPDTFADFGQGFSAANLI